MTEYPRYPPIFSMFRGCFRVQEGVLRISSDRDDRMIFLGLKFSISGFFGVGKFLQVFFLVA